MGTPGLSELMILAIEYSLRAGRQHRLHIAEPTALRPDLQIQNDAQGRSLAVAAH